MRDSDRQSEFLAAHAPIHGRRGNKSRSRQASWWARACVVVLVCAAAAIALSAQTFTTLHSFDSRDGGNPYAGLVQGTNGNLYGSTVSGGANRECLYGCGTLFEITPSGVLTRLHSFNDADGAAPHAGLIQAGDGDLYGTTFEGGATNGECFIGCGTIFEITAKGTLTTLHSFVGSPTEGALSEAALVQATNGSLYGTTSQGGADGGDMGGYGTVFEITQSGALTTLHSFCSEGGCADGEYPLGPLVQTPSGDFYGTAKLGGTYGGGTVFEITPTGTLTTLHSFCSEGDCMDGLVPYAGLVRATDGNFYGTTEAGGTYDGGTVFKITPSGTLTTLYSFCLQPNCTDGLHPYGALVQATDGNFYGTTYFGGANRECDGGYESCGTVFKITPKGTLTTLYSFCGQNACADGEYPTAALIQDTDGNLYGTTYQGGASDYGTVFSLSIGLGPFVGLQTTSGKVGARVKILGTNLTGATGVTFNGTAATFTVVSPSLITTTVPAGATTGTVQVVTPSGTLSSNVPFRVTQ